MTEQHRFDRDYWEQHWADGRGSLGTNPPNPYLPREVADLAPGTALDAGCGEGAEATWLATNGWQVTATDISPEALTRATAAAGVAAGGGGAGAGVGAGSAAAGVGAAGVAGGAGAGWVRWVEADLSVWEPGRQFDLVMTHYAHPAMPQLEFYDRLAGWVAPGGTLLIVGHLHTHAAAAAHGHEHSHGHGLSHGHGHQPPAEASATAAAVTARLDPADWHIVTAEECQRTLPGHGSTLHDVIVRATRRT